MKDDEFCCTETEADNNNPDAINNGKTNGDLIGADEKICNLGATVNDKCWYRRLCSDNNKEEQFGEDGNPDSAQPDYAECNYELECATAIVHSCNASHPNNNCQNECLSPGTDPATGLPLPPVVNCSSSFT